MKEFFKTQERRQRPSWLFGCDCVGASCYAYRTNGAIPNAECVRQTHNENEYDLEATTTSTIHTIRHRKMKHDRTSKSSVFFCSSSSYNIFIVGDGVVVGMNVVGLENDWIKHAHKIFTNMYRGECLCVHSVSCPFTLYQLLCNAASFTFWIGFGLLLFLLFLIRFDSFPFQKFCSYLSFSLFFLYSLLL